MKKTIGILFLLGMFGIQINAQTLTDNDIIGTWTVVKISNLLEITDEQKQAAEILKSAFLKAEFDFRADNVFSFDFEFEDMRIRNGHWKYNDLTKSFIVQEWKDKGTDDRILIEIFTKKEDDKILFLLAESFFSMEMRKE